MRLGDGAEVVRAWQRCRRVGHGLSRGWGWGLWCGGCRGEGLGQGASQGGQEVGGHGWQGTSTAGKGGIGGGILRAKGSGFRESCG